MYCSKCGKEIEDGEKFCSSCGERTDGEVNFDAIKNYAGQKVQETSQSFQDAAETYVYKFKEEQDARRIKDVSDIFIQKDEKSLSVLGGGYLNNLLKNGTLSKGFGILTHRRFYFRGKCFYKAGRQYLKTDEECIVDLQDITATGFVNHNYILLLLLSLVGFGVSVAPLSEGAILAAFMFWIPSVLLLLAYKFFKRTYYEVSFAGGCIVVKVSAYGIQKVRNFNKMLRIAKDELLAKEKCENYGM